MLGQDTVQQLLESLGIEIIDISGDELQAHCPAHRKRTGREDSNPSWYINTETGMHICFSCGFKGSIEYLIMVVKGYDDGQARAYISNADTNINVDLLLERLEQGLNRDALPARRTMVMPRSRLALFVPPPDWALRQRGLTAQACEAYGVLWDKDRDAWITPFHDSFDGSLMGWQEKGEIDRWFKNVPPMMKKSETLFGWPLAVPMDVTEVVAVESPLDAVRVYAVTGIVGVAFCGSMLSSRQRDLLRRFRRTILAFDNPRWDDAGRKAVRALYDDKTWHPWFFQYGDSDAKDPGEMRARDIRAGVENASVVVDKLGRALKAPQ